MSPSETPYVPTSNSVPMLPRRTHGLKQMLISIQFVRCLVGPGSHPFLTTFRSALSRPGPSVPKQADCSSAGHDRVDAVLQLAGRTVDVVVLDARLDPWRGRAESDGDLVGGVADDVEDQLGGGGWAK